MNKVNTKVDVRFHLDSANWLSDKVKAKLFEKVGLLQAFFQMDINQLKFLQVGSKLTKEGHLVFRSDVTRSQQLNLADALEKIRALIRESLYENPEPSAESQERARRRLERANIERIARKRHQSALKAERQLNQVEW